MKIGYQITRRDLVQALVYNLARSTRTQLLFLIGSVLVGGLFLLNRLSSKGTLGLGDLLEALSYMILFWIAVPILTLLFAKTQTRAFMINQSGIETTIGSQSGLIPWDKVDNIAVTDEQVIITGKNANAFVFPRQAFTDEQQRNEFVQLARQFHASATSSPVEE